MHFLSKYPFRRQQRRELQAIWEKISNQEYHKAFRLCQNIRKKRNLATNSEILYAGCCSLFGMGHIHQAEEWVKEYGETVKYAPSWLYLEAYRELHQGHTEKALLYWTDILQKDPSQTFADALIVRLKEDESKIHKDLKNPSSFRSYVPYSFLEDKLKPIRRNRRKLYPPYLNLAKNTVKKKREPWLRFFYGLLFLSLLGIISSLSLIFRSNLSSFHPTLLLSKLLDGTKNKDIFPEIPFSGDIIPKEDYQNEIPRFLYSSKKELMEDYLRAKLLAREGKVNQARYLLGRIEISNANFQVKERILIFRSLLPMIPFYKFHDPVDPHQLYQEPYLYRGAQILWMGKFLSKKGILYFYPIHRDQGEPLVWKVLVEIAPLQKDSYCKKKVSEKLCGIFIGIERDMLKIKTRNRPSSY